MAPLDETERTCAACGAVDPPGGLRLGPEGGGAEYDWFCRDHVACVRRISERGHVHRPGVPTRAPAEVHTYCLDCGDELE